MPCNTVQVNTVELEKVKDLDLLEQALRTEFGEVTRRGSQYHFTFQVDGYGVYVEGGRVNSVMRTDGLLRIVGRVKQAYSREAVKFAAKRFGWAVERSVDPNSFHIRKG